MVAIPARTTALFSGIEFFAKGIKRQRARAIYHGDVNFFVLWLRHGLGRRGRLKRENDQSIDLGACEKIPAAG
jgi:hypothetical protein